jgi:glycerol-3-phosphate dehydrogenase
VQRDPRRLQDAFDLLIVGAGVYGASIAWDAAQRGLSVALIDRGDIGGGTSFNNAKTVHGGVRALQRAQIAELRQYVRERRTLSRIAPHLVHPLPFLVPTRGRLHRGRAAMGIYFHLYDLLARDRNDGVAPSRQLGSTRLLSREACLAAHPALGDDRSITGGAMWFDGQLLSGDRVTLAFAASAAGAGAVVANHVELLRLLVHERRVVGAEVRDCVTGAAIEVRARLVINATGPWADRLVRDALGAGAAPLFDTLSLAMNVIVPPYDARVAIGDQARGRLFFLAPWRHVTVAGTSHDPIDGDPFAAPVTEARVAAFLDDLNAAFPAARLTLEAVRFVHRGLLPSHHAKGRGVRLVKHSIVRDHRSDGVDGLVSVVGARYTTARDTAEHAVDLACEMLGVRAAACRTATTPLDGGDLGADPGGDGGDPEVFAAQVERSARVLPAASRPRLARLYGTRWTALERLASERPELADPLAPNCEALAVEIVYAAREEMAVTLADALLRRSDAGSAGHPGDAAVRHAAALMAAELHWPPPRIEHETAAVAALYRPPT